MDDAILFDSLGQQIGIDYLNISGKPQWTTVCPACGTVSTRLEFKNSFGRIFGDSYGYKCFACNTAWSLAHLAAESDADAYDRSDIPVRQQEETVTAEPFWWASRRRLFTAYRENKEKYEAWWKYKRIPPPMVDKYGLGYGQFPHGAWDIENAIAGESQAANRLMTFFGNLNGSTVWARGRRAEAGGIKWRGLGGVSPYDVSLPLAKMCKGGGIVAVVENAPDAALIHEYCGMDAVATLSVSYWSDAWTKQLRQLNPEHVLILYDADVAGNGPVSSEQLHTVAKHRIEKSLPYINPEADGLPVQITGNVMTDNGWNVYYTLGEQEKINIFRIPIPGGVRLLDKLRKAGFDSVSLGKWEKPQAGMDVGALYLDDWMTYAKSNYGSLVDEWSATL